MRQRVCAGRAATLGHVDLDLPFLCARLLRREAPAIGLSRDFVIYDSSDQLSVVKQALAT